MGEPGQGPAMGNLRYICLAFAVAGAICLAMLAAPKWRFVSAPLLHLSSASAASSK